MAFHRHTFTLAGRQIEAVRVASKALGMSKGASEVMRRALDQWIDRERQWLIKHGWEDREPARQPKKPKRRGRR